MSWFRKKQDPVDREIREVEKELRRLQAEMRRLQREAVKPASTFKPAATALPPGWRPSSEPPAPAPPAREPDLWTRPEAPSNHAGDGSGRSRWWRKLFGPKPGPSDPRLVSYLSTGSFKTVRPLRYERRVARNRFLLSLGLLLVAVWLLVLALRNC